MVLPLRAFGSEFGWFKVQGLGFFGHWGLGVLGLRHASMIGRSKRGLGFRVLGFRVIRVYWAYRVCRFTLFFGFI